MIQAATLRSNLDFKLLMVTFSCDDSSCNAVFKCLSSSCWLLFPAAMNQAATLCSNPWLQAADCCFQLRWFKLQRCVPTLDFKLLIVASNCDDSSCNAAFKCLTSSCWLLLPDAMIQATTLRLNNWLQAADCSFPAADADPGFTLQIAVDPGVNLLTAVACCC